MVQLAEPDGSTDYYLNECVPGLSEGRVRQTEADPRGDTRVPI